MSTAVIVQDMGKGFELRLEREDTLISFPTSSKMMVFSSKSVTALENSATKRAKQHFLQFHLHFVAALCIHPLIAHTLSNCKKPNNP